jgi:predicted kinase
MQATLIVVTGLPGTGKSTAAHWIAESSNAPVLGHDWAMSGLRPFPAMQDALDSMQPPGHAAVGWSILRALARSQLREGRSVVLDGVARAAEVALCRQIADAEGARCIVILTECADAELHRHRVEGRQRAIPDWYELDWDHVQRSRANWTAPSPVDLTLEATDSPETNRRKVCRLVECE